MCAVQDCACGFSKSVLVAEKGRMING
jgi:hypothetical protein